jgi:dienelactone hydrolase
VGLGAATVLETELTAAGIPHNLKVYPGAKHVFFNDQLRLLPGRGPGTPSSQVGADIPAAAIWHGERAG